MTAGLWVGLGALAASVGAGLVWQVRVWRRCWRSRRVRAEFVQLTRERRAMLLEAERRQDTERR
jgi:hypothetical protein